jgi:hypothetical protein
VCGLRLLYSQRQRSVRICASALASRDVVYFPGDLSPGYAGVERAAQAPSSAVGVPRGGQARDPGLKTTSTRRIMPKTDSGDSTLAPLLYGSIAGELIPELVRHGLQQLIKLEVEAVHGVERHERTEDRSGYRNGSRPRLLTTQVGTSRSRSPNSAQGASSRRSLSPGGGSTRRSTRTSERPGSRASPPARWTPWQPRSDHRLGSRALW